MITRAEYVAHLAGEVCVHRHGSDPGVHIRDAQGMADAREATEECPLTHLFDNIDGDGAVGGCIFITTLERLVDRLLSDCRHGGDGPACNRDGLLLQWAKKLHACAVHIEAEISTAAGHDCPRLDENEAP